MNNTYELLYLSRLGDDSALSTLFSHCMPYIYHEVTSVIAKYQPLSLYKDDFVQECRIAAVSAMECYREDKDCNFSTFLTVVIKRKLIGLLRYYSAATKVQMHQTVSLDSIMLEKGAMYDRIENMYQLHNPVYSMHMNESFERVKETTRNFSSLEKKIMKLWMEGTEYNKASQMLGITYKSYDGHIQRIKKKLKAAALATSF